MRTAGVTPGLGGGGNESVGMEIEATYLEAELGESELGLQRGQGFRAVRYDGTVFPVHVGPAERREVELIRYRVRESWSLEAYAERFADRYRVPTGILSPDERAVLSDVVAGDGYAVTDDDGPAESLIGTLREHESFPVGVVGRDAVASPTFPPPWRSETWVVRVEGRDRFVKLFERTDD